MDENESFEVLARITDQALATGQTDAAAPVVATRIAQLAEDCEAGSLVSRDAVTAAAHCAMRFASATEDGSWVNLLVRLYCRRVELPAAELVNELYGTLRRARGVDWSLFARYVESLRRRSGSFGPAGRFTTKRLEGLMRFGPELGRP